MAKKSKARSKKSKPPAAAPKRVLRMPPPEASRPRRRSKAIPSGSPVVQQLRAQSRTSDDVTIIGVGASAGGLEAFSSMLRVFPPNPGFAVVLVQHLAPQHESALPTLLTSYTSMPVLQVTDRLRAEPNH